MQTDIFDVVIVGSGASGGTLASHLARRGVKVAIVEGGPRVNTRTDFNTHAMPFDFPTRQVPTMRPGKVGFDSERSRGVGGKTMLWNAVALRLSQRDFKGRTFEGAGEDWPIGYKDIAPYYDTIEREVGVCGNRDGLEDLPDGIFLPPVPLKCSDEILRRAARSLGGNVIHVRKATLTVPTKTRLACHFCGNCMAGCDVVAKYNSADVHIAPAEQSGRVTVFPDCIVREVLMSDENRATGVRYLHRVHQQEGEVRGRTVVVACACVQSIALLMMSTSSRYPTGLANSSGQLGRHFIPHFTGGIECLLDGLRGKAATNDEGFLDHAYLPSFMHKRKRGYARSFGAQLNYQNRRFAGWAKAIGGFGKTYKAAVKAGYPAFIQFTPYGEMLPNAQSYVDLDPDPDRQVRAAATPPPRALGRERRGALQRHGALEPGDAREGGGGNPHGARRSGAQPRARRLPHGTRSKDFGRQRRLPQPRRSQPLRRRWQRLSVGIREEPDAHDHGARSTRRRTHRRADEER